MFIEKLYSNIIKIPVLGVIKAGTPIEAQEDVIDYIEIPTEWTKGNKAWELNEYNIHKFKGITAQDNFPYAQFYKGAFAYSDMVNHSSMPFVLGTRNLNFFQLDTPIIAG